MQRGVVIRLGILAGTCSIVVSAARGGFQSTRPSFDVASIKRGDPYALQRFAVSGRRFIDENAPLMDLIQWAYHAANWQVSGGPDWLQSERYDIEAIKPQTASANVNLFQDEELRMMVQALLEERCKLRLHHQTKTGPVYELAVAKSGPRLTAAAAESDDQNEYRGVGDGMRTSHGATLLGRHASMADLAFDLSRKLSRPVLNKTKLEGLYDFQIEYSRRDEDDAPSIFTALRDRLGLTLNPAKGPVDILVIDSIERPSAN